MTCYAQGAARLCQSRDFWAYIEHREAGSGVTVSHHDSARDWIYATLEITSRTELDQSEESAAGYLAMLSDFNRWLAARRTGR